jgi:hypothetical protein
LDISKHLIYLAFCAFAIEFESAGATQVLFHRATKTVRIEMICRSFNQVSKKLANNFVPLPYQPEHNDLPVQTPPTGSIRCAPSR